ncbi:hypothetical protein ACWGB8_02660 [Kitasatospora sp. NPDC054939]
MLTDRAYWGVGSTVRTPCRRHHELLYCYRQYNRDPARQTIRTARCSTNRVSRVIAVVHTPMGLQNPG